jgi:hypothetical protein
VTWLDRLMDKLTSRGTKMVASGHGPEDFQPETGFGPETTAAEPPSEGAEPADSNETA